MRVRPRSSTNGWIDDVRLDLDVGLDPGRLRVDDRDPGEHVAQVDPVAEDGRGLGELGPGVHPCLERLRREVNRDLLAVPDEQPDRVGEVELALGVVRLDPVEGRPELLGAEDVDRGVGLAERELLGGRVAGLDDPLEAPVGAPHEPPVGARVVVLDPEHRRGGAGLAVSPDEVAQQLGVEQYRVAGEDEHVLGPTLEHAP